MFFKKQLFATTSTELKSKVLDILRQNNIKYYLKTKDNFGGGMFSERRFTGSFGMETSSRFVYQIFVSKKEYESAAYFLQQSHL
ncbi:hypothetical protein IMSAGC005_02086 [Lachnospiraceae bacterium]|nr:hypothetical protein IMSAGC005_02086 [Lachnospiraceae bacterium]